MQRQKWVNSCVCVATMVFVAASGMIPNHIHASEPDQTEIAPVASGVVEGRVIEAEQLTLVIEKANGEVVRVPMPGKSGESSSEFEKGDYIEVAISPEGITTSVRKVAQTKN
ncbi:MAG: hypothetical protein NPIRA03_11140 [Nitrospirales bacterium]|nr:MAG: hypothetical protein NPIRA03_11140 [Nitrospirales bacterium]